MLNTEKEESMLSKFHDILKNRFGWYGELHDAIEELPTSREFEQATLDLLAQDNPYCEYFMGKAFDFNQNPAIIKRGFESEHAGTRAKAFELLNDLNYDSRLNVLKSWLIVRE